jgi:uroporphyrinogen III methyltransferase / synthase
METATGLLPDKKKKTVMEYMESATETEQRNSGTVYLIGAGPGDPGLITVKGLDKIRAADVIVYDYLADERLIQQAKPTAELIYVGKKGSDHTLEQANINELLVQKAKEGKNIARVKGGDPYVFGRGGEEAEALAEANVPFEIIPGVTSAVAASAYAGIPVTHRDHASMVTFITGHEDPTKEGSAIDWKVLAGNPGTLVFLMGVKNLRNISKSLIENGKAPDTPAALVRWGTTARQVSLAATLREIPSEAERMRVGAPAVLVVGSVVSLRDKLTWFERKPLFGKRILVTRSREQSGRMAERIGEMGGEAVLFPTIRIMPPEDTRPLDEAIQKISSFDWVIFTSVNGVERFFKRFYELRDDIRDMAGPRIAAIGPITARAIQERSLKVNRLAKEFTAEGLLVLFAADEVSGKRFLIPRAEKAREILPQTLINGGGLVDVVPVYRTGFPEESEINPVRKMLETEFLHAVTFTSSSTVTHFVEMLKASDLRLLLRGVAIASIGPVTSGTLRENGLPVDVEASEYTIDGLLEALANYFKSRQE